MNNINQDLKDPIQQPPANLVQPKVQKQKKAKAEKKVAASRKKVEVKKQKKQKLAKKAKIPANHEIKEEQILQPEIPAQVEVHPQAPAQQQGLVAPAKVLPKKRARKQNVIEEEKEPAKDIQDQPMPLVPAAPLIKKVSTQRQQIVLYKIGDYLIYEEDEEEEEEKMEQNQPIVILKVTKNYLKPQKKKGGQAQLIEGQKYVQQLLNQAPRNRFYTFEPHEGIQIDPSKVVSLVTAAPQGKKNQVNFAKSEINRHFQVIDQNQIVPEKIVKRQKADPVQKAIQKDREEIKEGEEIPKKRVKKAAAKKAKKEEEPERLPREEVKIPEALETFTSPEINHCCQTCANRSVYVSAKINSLDLFMLCLKSRATVSSLLEQLSPEIHTTVVEEAIKMNRCDILETLLLQDKPENEFRIKKRQSQIEKFETGEVGEMAFGYKVRKVNMMRGNRQGNNAFLEDPTHAHQLPVDYLLKQETCLRNAFKFDTVEEKTFLTIRKCLGEAVFQDLLEKLIPILMRNGCYNSLIALFKIQGHLNDVVQSFFNHVFYELLTFEPDKENPFTITEQDLALIKRNQKASYAHVAALNPSGAALKYLSDNGHEIDVKLDEPLKHSTAHYAAVCTSPKNLMILIEKNIDLHDQDQFKQTPLMWALQSQKPLINVKTIMDSLDKNQKDFKDEQKNMAIHHLCRTGIKEGEYVNQWLDFFVLHKAKFSMLAGFNKYTPLILAATHGHRNIVEYLITNVPRLNLNKGDKFKRSALLMACRNGHADIVALLIKHHADSILSDTSGNSPLHHASAYGWHECVRILLQYGEDINPSAENAWMLTPIMIALQKNHNTIVKELLTTGQINLNAKDDEGRTILALAMSNINAESIKLIEQLLEGKHGLDPNIQDAKGRTPMYHLVNAMSQRRSKNAAGLFGDQDHEELEFNVIKMLITGGANMNIKAKDGKSPFTIAFESGMTDLLKLFGGQIDLNNDPSLFFVFTGVSVLKENVHLLLGECMNGSSKKRMEDESINYVNDQGFTPFLWYIKEFLFLKQSALNQIQVLLNPPNRKTISAEDIIEQIEQQKQLQVAPIVTDKAKEIYNKEIVEPFLKFLKVLLENGANPNAYVLKHKQFREEVLLQTQPSQFSQIGAAALLGRRPPEKDQYISEALGLSNALHMLIDNPVRELFDFLVSLKGINIDGQSDSPPILNQVNFQKMSPFFKLVRTKNIQEGDFKHCFDSLLATRHVDIDSPDQFGVSAFWYLYTNNRQEEAFYLVSQFNANINHIDNYGVFALKRELFANNFAMFKKLLEKGANPNMTDEFQRTVLHLACDYAHRKDYKEVFKILIKHNAGIQELDFKDRSPLHYLFVKKNKRHEVDHFDPQTNGSCLELLLNNQTKNQFSVNQQDVNGKTLLHNAAQRGSHESLDYLVKLYGADQIDINLEDKFLNTPLSIAVECRHFTFVEKLLFHFKQNINLRATINPENRQPKRAQQNLFGGGGLFGGGLQQQDDEQSDFEYMQFNQDLQDNLQPKIKKDENALNLFRHIIRHNIQDMERLFISKGYDRIQMVVDYICEGKINKLFEVIDTHFKDTEGAKGSIIIQRNNKGQSLIHVLARNSHLIKEGISELTKLYKQLVDQGVPSSSDDVDNKGRNALHFAVKGGNLSFIKFLIEVEKYQVNKFDFAGVSPLNLLLKGDRILTANIKLLKYLINEGANLNNLYEESTYGQKYKCTSVIHAIRHESKDRSNIKLILKALLVSGADAGIQDSLGKDAFVYAVIRNHSNTFHFILDSLSDDLEPQEEEKGDQIIQKQHQKIQIKKDSVDSKGKSLIHYIVNPLPYGSYENSNLLKRALQEGFLPNIRDKTGRTPYDYAKLQQSGVLKKIFEDNVQAEALQAEDKNEIIDGLQDIIRDNNNVLKPVYFEDDAHSYLEEIQMQIDPHNFVPCDPTGKFNDDCIVMFDDGKYNEAQVELEDVKIDDIEEEKQGNIEMINIGASQSNQKKRGTQQHFDVYLTRVEIGKFQPGGDYLFYRMQLVLDQARGLPILLTRWGRIGEEGAFQKTPFGTIQEAVAEFKKVFEQKTGCKWCTHDKFKKHFRKFQLMRTNYITIDQKNFLLPFTHEQQILPSAILTAQSIEVLREICDVETYLRALKASGVDPKAMPFSNLDRKNLYDALEILEKLQKTLTKLEGMNPRPYAEGEKMKLLSLREKMWYLSSRFYEFIPHEEFRNKMVPPISNQNLLVQKSAMLLNLIQIEMASKILLGALLKVNDKINPLEYCIRAVGVNFDVLQKDDPEYKLIQGYVNHTYYDFAPQDQRRNLKTLTNIIRLNKSVEQERFQRNLKNRVLLFHGTKVSNILGILSQGLRAQPIEVQRNGNLLGKGIYFSDMVAKSIQYTADNANNSSGRYIFVCEVALGKSKELLRFNNNFVLEEGYNSVVGLGKVSPDDEDSFKVTLPDGAIVPLGKVKNHQGGPRQNSDFQHNEFVVPDSTQVRLRYLLQFK